jgi:hypothetical protein
VAPVTARGGGGGGGRGACGRGGGRGGQRVGGGRGGGGGAALGVAGAARCGVECIPYNHIISQRNDAMAGAALGAAGAARCGAASLARGALPAWIAPLRTAPPRGDTHTDIPERASLRSGIGISVCVYTRASVTTARRRGGTGRCARWILGWRLSAPSSRGTRVEVVEHGSVHCRTDSRQC